MARLRALWEEIATMSPGAEGATAVWRETAEEMFVRYLDSGVAGMATIATEKEVNLAVVVDERAVLMRGFIDRLCRDDDGRAWIVDYKTNRSLGHELLAAYGRQLAIYQRAAREVLGLDAGALLVEMRTGAVHRQEGDGWPEVRRCSPPWSGRSIGACEPAMRRMRVLAGVPLVDATARQRSAPLTVAEDGDRILGR